MLSVPLRRPRATRGTTTSDSGSGGVSATKRTRGSSSARFASTGSRCSTAQPVIPSPYENGSSASTFSESRPEAYTAFSSRLASSAS